MPTLTCSICEGAIIRRGRITCCRTLSQRLIFTIRRSNSTRSLLLPTRGSPPRPACYTISTNQPRRGSKRRMEKRWNRCDSSRALVKAISRWDFTTTTRKAITTQRCANYASRGRRFPTMLTWASIPPQLKDAVGAGRRRSLLTSTRNSSIRAIPSRSMILRRPTSACATGAPRPREWIAYSRFSLILST